MIDNRSIIPWTLMIDYKIKHFDYRRGNIDFLRDLICIKLSWPKTSPWILFNVIINIIFSLTINIILGFSRFNRSLHSIHKQIFVGYMYYVIVFQALLSVRVPPRIRAQHYIHEWPECERPVDPTKWRTRICEIIIHFLQLLYECLDLSFLTAL